MKFLQSFIQTTRLLGVSMKSYVGFFKMAFKGELQYRAKAISGVVTQLFWGFMYVYLYTAFMGGKVIDGFSIPQMATYIWLGQAFFAMRYIALPQRSGAEITNGNVCYKFVRPVNIYDQWYAEHLGQKVSSTLLRFAPIVIITMFLPANIGFSLPVSFLAFVLFIVSLVVGCLMAVSLSMLAIFITFKTLSPKGSLVIVQTITGLLGGMYIPIPLMPAGVQKVLMWLPFRYVSDLPFRIYIGNVGTIDALMQIGISLAWLVAIILLGKLLIKRSLKSTVIQGG